MPTTSRADQDSGPGNLADEHIFRHLTQGRVAPTQGGDLLGAPAPARLAVEGTVAAGQVGEAGQISSDLAATLIERIFDAGLLLAGAWSMVDAGPARERMAAAVDELDSVVGEIRRAVFMGQAQLGPTPGPW